MAGPDLPFGGSGGTSPPPGTPPTSGDDDAGPPSSLPRRSTRISASASARQDVDEAVDGTVRLARRAAAGSLRSTTTRGRDHADVERMREVILEVRQAPSVPVPADDADSPYPKKQKIHRSGTRSSGRVACQISYLSSSPKKRVGTDPVVHLASVPEWKNAPSEEDTADYKAETLQKLGIIVCPLNMDISSTDEPEKTRKERVDKCNCSHPGSEDCVRVHVKKARSWIKDQLGEETFGNCGLDAMGEHVRELWTAKDKRKLDNIDKLIPQKKHKKFMKIALKQLSRKKTKDLAKYYYNVFLPRRLASLTRAEPKKDEDVDMDEDDSNQDDDNNGHRSRKKSKSSGSSSKWVAEILAGVAEVEKAKPPMPEPSVPEGDLVCSLLQRALSRAIPWRSEFEELKNRLEESEKRRGESEAELQVVKARLSEAESSLKRSQAYAGKLEEDLEHVFCTLELALVEVGVAVFPCSPRAIRMVELVASVSRLKPVVEKLLSEQLQQVIRDVLAMVLALLKCQHPELSLEALQADLPASEEEELLDAVQGVADAFADCVQAPGLS